MDITNYTVASHQGAGAGPYAAKFAAQTYISITEIEDTRCRLQGMHRVYVYNTTGSGFDGLYLTYNGSFTNGNGVVRLYTNGYYADSGYVDLGWIGNGELKTISFNAWYTGYSGTTYSTNSSCTFQFVQCPTPSLKFTVGDKSLQNASGIFQNNNNNDTLIKIDGTPPAGLFFSQLHATYDMETSAANFPIIGKGNTLSKTINPKSVIDGFGGEDAYLAHLKSVGYDNYCPPGFLPLRRGMLYGYAQQILYYAEYQRTSNRLYFAIGKNNANEITVYDSSGNAHRGIVTAYDSSGNAHDVDISAYNSAGAKCKVW